MTEIQNDEWRILCEMLPHGWQDAARSTKAFRRARYITDPGIVLRLLLFHAVHDGGLRETVSLARAGGLADVSQVALLKRLHTSGDWLSWIAQEMCADLRINPRLRSEWRIRAVDSSSISGPKSTGTDWRLHYSINLSTLDCDWHELTDVHGGEALARTPMAPGDLLLADRNYLTPLGLDAAAAADARVLIRLRWRHLAMSDPNGHPFFALNQAKRLKVGQMGDWPVEIRSQEGNRITGRVIALRVPRLIAAQAQRRLDRAAQKKCKKSNAKSIVATNYIMLFTTVPSQRLSTADALELYRCRWQIELAFKRLKQLLSIGRLPHRDPLAARSWILSKMVVSLLIEKLLRNARTFSPWGYMLSPRKAAA